MNDLRCMERDDYIIVFSRSVVKGRAGAYGIGRLCLKCYCKKYKNKASLLYFC